MQPTVQLQCTVTVAVQTETAEISGHAVRHVTFPSSGAKLKQNQLICTHKTA